jgi:non-ribosomal peptide synthetase component F
VPSYRGARAIASLDAGLSGELSRLARRHEATLFMVLLAGFQALLWRLSGQEDLAMGSPIANRNRSEIEPLIGFFVNTLVLRGDLSGEPSFDELLARVRRSTLEAFAHQDLPFERLVEELSPDRHLALNPLFQVAFALQNAGGGAMELPGLALDTVEVEVATVRFDLELFAWEAADSVAMALIYSTDLFDPATVQRLAGHLERLLRAAAAEPGRRLSELPLLPAAERHQLLHEWRAAEGGAEEMEGGIAAWVAAWAAAQPAAPAVVSGGRTLTYGELLDRASRLAGELRSLGAGPGESPVGLYVERSPELIVGALAVLLAGGAYLPLDPGSPAERLAFVARESGMRVLLARGPAAPSWADGVRVLNLDGVSASAPAAPVPTHPGDLAYVIYTSG